MPPPIVRGVLCEREGNSHFCVVLSLEGCSSRGHCACVPFSHARLMPVVVVTAATEEVIVEGFANLGGACLWAIRTSCDSVAVTDGPLGRRVCKTLGKLYTYMSVHKRGKKERRKKQNK